jgi:hypothetical protein
MTRSSDIIARALDFALDKDPATLRVIIDIAVEYKIAVDHALKIERVLHTMIKESEK